MISGVVAGSCPTGSSTNICLQHHLRFHLPHSLQFPQKNKTWPSLHGPSSPSPSSSSYSRASVEDGVVEEEETKQQRKSLYDLLGISEDGRSSLSTAEIKRAYKEMARRYHPDVCPSPERAEEYTRRFIEVQQAYETLSDPARRARYDQDLSRGLHLAFSARCGRFHDEDLEEKSKWRNRWQDQVAELRRRSMSKDSGNMSWGARMRRQREESSTE